MIDFNQLTAMHDKVIPVFNEKWNSAERNERYKRAINWTEQEIAEIESQGRNAYSIGIIPTKINQFLAAQRKNRTSWRVLATQDPNDEIKAEVATIQLRDLEKRSNFKYLESDIFDAGLSVAYGVAKIVLEKSRHGEDVVSVKSVDYRNFIWDINSREYEHNDAAWVAEIERMYRYEAEERYGTKIDEIVTSNTELFGRDKENYWFIPDKNNIGKFSPYDIISVFTHYQKVNRTYYNLIFNDYMNGNIVVEKFRTMKEANARLMELENNYLTNPDGSFDFELNGKVVEETKAYLDKYVFTYAGILEYEETEMCDFPYSIYHAFQFETEFWTLTDILRDPQMWTDRLFSQIDYAFGKDIKNGLEVNINMLAENNTPEQVVRKLENQEPVFVKANGAISSIRTDGANPQWMLMTNTMKSLIEDMSGGRAFQGLSESADESGRAIALKQQQGESIAALFLDNLNRWKKDLGQKILWFLKKYDTAERIIKIGGGDISPEMVQLLMQKGLAQQSTQDRGSVYVKANAEETGIHFLDDMDYELLVSEDILSETSKEKRMQQMMLAEQQNPNLVQSKEWMRLRLETMDFPYHDRQKLLQEFEQLIQQQQQMQQQELDIKKADVLTKMPIQNSAENTASKTNQQTY